MSAACAAGIQYLVRHFNRPLDNRQCNFLATSFLNLPKVYSRVKWHQGRSSILILPPYQRYNIRGWRKIHDEGRFSKPKPDVIFKHPSWKRCSQPQDTSTGGVLFFDTWARIEKCSERHANRGYPQDSTLDVNSQHKFKPASQLYFEPPLPTLTRNRRLKRTCWSRIIIPRLEVCGLHDAYLLDDSRGHISNASVLCELATSGYWNWQFSWPVLPIIRNSDTAAGRDNEVDLLWNFSCSVRCKTIKSWNLSRPTW